jgi:hypothetical protein
MNQRQKKKRALRKRGGWDKDDYLFFRCLHREFWGQDRRRARRTRRVLNRTGRYGEYMTRLYGGVYKPVKTTTFKSGTVTFADGQTFPIFDATLTENPL